MVLKLPFMRETWGMVLPVLAAALVLGIGGFRSQRTWAAAAGLGLLVLAAVLLNFFRDFERKVPAAAGMKDVVSPADGVITLLRETDEPLHLKRRCLQVAVFMNPLDNHVQRAPFSGRVAAKVYHPGKFLAAYEDKADLVNEQSHLVLELDPPGKGRILLKQIAGFLCHRVRTDPPVGRTVERGGRIGRILLGSRVDVFLPLGFKPVVKVGDRVRAGETVLGELP
jgi:phosphatidylserine decarboxylase